MIRDHAKLLIFIFVFIGCATSGTKQADQHPSVEIDQDGNVLCHKFAAEGDIQTLKKYWRDCKNYLNLNATTLLMVAASRNQIVTMEYLIQEGADINEKDFNGDTALAYATINGNEKSVAWLLQHGANSKSYRADKITPLMLAINLGFKKKIEIFLDKNINQTLDINAQMQDGWSAIFYAVNKQDLDLVKRLVSLGANANLKTPTKETPLKLAIEDEWSVGIEYLKSLSKKQESN